MTITATLPLLKSLVWGFLALGIVHLWVAYLCWTIAYRGV